MNMFKRGARAGARAMLRSAAIMAGAARMAYGLADFRISFATSLDLLERGIDRLAQAALNPARRALAISGGRFSASR
ncbi:MAG TPA: hypothetical protein VEA17_19170 [Bordetella sp.]|nr:hypothetical protein [Bordetella sp.]